VTPSGEKSFQSLYNVKGEEITFVTDKALPGRKKKKMKKNMLVINCLDVLLLSPPRPMYFILMSQFPYTALAHGHKGFRG